MSNQLAELQSLTLTLGQAISELSEKLETLKEENTPIAPNPIEWCGIPEGKVEISGKTVEVEAFRMAKYAVTNDDFNKFIEDPEGYRDSRWWEGAPVEAKEEDPSIVEDKLDHPRVNVNWYEATAYCRWISHKLGYEITLPHESQWQWAACSCDTSYNYPWGKEFDKTRCNTWESGIHDTVPVDACPEGASEQGVFNLSGNTWEWCSNKYREEHS